MCLRDLASSRRQGQVSRLWPAPSPGDCKRGALPAHTLILCSHASPLPLEPSGSLLLPTSWIRTKLSAGVVSVGLCCSP